MRFGRLHSQPPVLLALAVAGLRRHQRHRSSRQRQSRRQKALWDKIAADYNAAHRA